MSGSTKIERYGNNVLVNPDNKSKGNEGTVTVEHDLRTGKLTITDHNGDRLELYDITDWPSEEHVHSIKNGLDVGSLQTIGEAMGSDMQSHRHHYCTSYSGMTAFISDQFSAPTYSDGSSKLRIFLGEEPTTYRGEHVLENLNVFGNFVRANPVLEKEVIEVEMSVPFSAYDDFTFDVIVRAVNYNPELFRNGNNTQRDAIIKEFLREQEEEKMRKEEEMRKEDEEEEFYN